MGEEKGSSAKFVCVSSEEYCIIKTTSLLGTIRCEPMNHSRRVMGFLQERIGFLLEMVYLK